MVVMLSKRKNYTTTNSGFIFHGKNLVRRTNNPFVTFWYHFYIEIVGFIYWHRSDQHLEGFSWHWSKSTIINISCVYRPSFEEIKCNNLKILRKLWSYFIESYPSCTCLYLCLYTCSTCQTRFQLNAHQASWRWFRLKTNFHNLRVQNVYKYRIIQKLVYYLL